MIDDEIRVHMRHVRNPPPYGAKLCASGCKRWFESRDMDFRRFLDEGIPISVLVALDDAIANKVIEAARREAEDLKVVGNG